MDLIHRLNPFHHRPPSSSRNNTTRTPSPAPSSFPAGFAPVEPPETDRHSKALNIPHQARPSSSLEDPFPSVAGSRYDRDQAQTPTGTTTYTNPSIDSTMPSLYMDSSDERYLARTPIHTEAGGTPSDPTFPVPAPMPVSSNVKGQKRAPSILRSLAHHPSLSALKNRSKRKKRKDVPTSPLPRPITSALTQEDRGSVGGRLRKKSLKASRSVPRDMRLSTESQDEPLPPLPTATASTTLASYQARSLTSSQSTNTRYDMMISPSALPKRTTSIRRKPAPSPSPDLVLAKRAPTHFDRGLQPRQSGEDVQTPESLRFRMRFELDFTDDFQAHAENHQTDGAGMSQNHYAEAEIQAQTVGGKRQYGLGVGTPGRRRYMSFDERSSARFTEEKAGRHLSTPANDGSPSRSPQHQHQHDQPLQLHQHHQDMYAQSLYADSTDFVSSQITPARQVQLQRHHQNQSQSYHQRHNSTTWDSDIGEGENDGFGLFVKNEEVPPGTPGGKKEDLQRGAFVDGAKHEPDAIRFFSRDMYALPSATPSPSTSDHTSQNDAKHLSPTKSVRSPHRRAESDHLTPTRSPKHRRAESSPAASPIRLRKQAFDKAAKRSSSPFEVKLAPSVTKRMSLDAFGTPTPPRSDDDHGFDQDALEEVLENVWEDNVDQDVSLIQHDVADDLSLEDHEEIATASQEKQLEDGGLEAHLSHHLSTINETPSSLEISEGDIPIYLTPAVQRPRSSEPATRYFTPLSPLLDDRGLPTPSSHFPSPLTRKYLSAPPLAVTSSLLQAHSDHTRALKDQLEASEVVIDVLRGEIDELRDCVQIEKKARQSLAGRLDEQEGLAEELAGQCEGKEAALNQLRQAMVENEEFFDDLQDAHDALAEQCATLNQNKAELKHERESDALALENVRSDLEKLHDELADEKLKSSQVEASKKELEGVVFELEGVVFELRRELKWAETQVAEKDEQLLAERLSSSQVRSESGRVAKELETAQENIKVKNAEIASLEQKKAFLVARYQGQIGALEFQLKDLGEKEEAEMSVLKKELEAEREQLEKVRQRADESEQAAKEKDDIISYLRELLASEQSASKEAQNASVDHSAQLANLEGKLSSTEQTLKAANLSLLEKEASIQALSEKLSLARYERNEKHFEVEVELNQLRERMEEVTRDAAEREWAAREGREMMGRLMEEKRVWEEEREELVDMLNRNSADENSLSNLRSRIDSLTDQLSASTRQIHHLQGELEDAHSSVEHKSTLIHAQEAELSALRLTLTHLEDNMTSAKEAHDRQIKDSERIISRLRSQVEELELQISLHEGALKNALTESYSSKVNSADHTSRIQRYLTEIDQLKLSEIKLQSQLEEMQRSSASDEIKSVELEKRVRGLEEDKELLNVALESKTLELTLLQRQTQLRQSRVLFNPLAASGSISRSARPTSFSTSKAAAIATPSMSRSTSRIPATPTPMNGVDSTPLSRRLATSTSSTIRTRRETVSGGSTGGTSSGRTPLGASTVHNRAPTQPRALEFGSANPRLNADSSSSVKVISSKKGEEGVGLVSTTNERAEHAVQQLQASVEAAAAKKVERRSSLPVLRIPTSGGRPGSALGVSMAARRESLISIDEDQ
ncbi:hypothetical protein IAT40_000538 [Kwoniella sp. CBS 6097]